MVAAASALRCDARLLPTCRDESAMGSPTVEEEGRRARASHVAVWGARVGIGRALGLTFSCGMAVTRRALSTSVSCLFLLRSFRSCRCCCRRARPAADGDGNGIHNRTGAEWSHVVCAGETARGACFCLRDWCLLLVITLAGCVARLSLDLSSTSGSCAWRGATRVQGGAQGKVRVYSYIYVDLMIPPPAAYVYYVMLKKEVLCTKVRIKKGKGCIC